VSPPKPIRDTGGHQSPSPPSPSLPPDAGGLGPSGAPGAPDPWGVKRAENLLTSLTGVLSASVVVTPQGEVSEIHILTRNDIPAKQVVRNIESALMAQLGMKIDHRKISVAQTADVRPIEELQEDAILARVSKRVVTFKGLEVRPGVRPQRVAVRVKLGFGDREAEMEEQGTDTMRNRVALSGPAVARQLDRARGRDDHRRLRSQVRARGGARARRAGGTAAHGDLRDPGECGARFRFSGARRHESLDGCQALTYKLLL